MSGIVVLGEDVHVRGFALAGAAVEVAEGQEEVTRAWEQLTKDAGLLVLTPAAAEILDDRLEERPWLLWTVIPE